MSNSRTDIFRRACWKAMHYAPTVEQNKFHQSPARLKAVFGGVRGGKSFSLAMEICQYGCIDKGLGWLIGPDYERCRPEFDYLVEIYTRLQVIDPSNISRPARGQCRLQLSNGFVWQTKSSDDIPSLAGYAPDVVAVCEAAPQSEEVFGKAIERATEKDAPVIFSGTFEKARQWYVDLYERWHGSNPEGGAGFSIPTWSNLKLFPGGRRDPKIITAEKSMPSELFHERYGGVPSKPTGLVFPKFERVTHCRPLEELLIPKAPVELWIDPATKVYAILFVQKTKEGHFHIIDEIYAKDEIGQEVIPRVISLPWWEQCKSGVMDIAGSYRAGANRSQVEVWNEECKRLGTHNVSFAYNYVYEQEWRNAIQLHLYNPATGKPMLYFADHLTSAMDSEGKPRGILAEMLSYRWREAHWGKSESKRPIKANEDALSALGYGIFHHKGPVVERQKLGVQQVRSYF